MSDQQFADAMHSKFYTDIPKNEYYSKIGYEPPGFFQEHFINPLKQTKGRTALETAGNLTDLLINKPIEMTGLPSFGRGVFQGAEQILRSVGNIPADIAAAMGNEINPINIPGTKQQIYPIPRSEFPSPQNVNPYVREAGETAGSLLGFAPAAKIYQGVKSGLNAIPVVKNLPDLVKSLLAAETTGAASMEEDRALGAGLGGAGELAFRTPGAIAKGVNRYRTAPQRKALEKEAANLAAIEAEEKGLQNQASHQFSQKNPERLLMTVEDQIRELQQGRNLVSNYMTPDMMVQRPGQQTVPETQFQLNKVNDALRTALGEGQANSQNLSRSLVNDIEGVPVIEPHPKTGLPREVRQGGLREEIGQKYDVLEEDLPESLEVPGNTDMKAVEKELEKFTSKGAALNDKEKENFRKILASTHPSSKNKNVNGRAFFRAYRSLRRVEGEERSKAHSIGISPKDHDEWIARADDTKNTYENMEKIINDHFPEDTIKKLHEINHEYSTRVAPLHENPMYQQMLKHGNYKGNVLEYLSGTTKGNDILSNLLKNNPEYARMAIGDIYAAKPQDLLKPNDILKEYSNVNPEISRLMGQQRQAQANVQRAETEAPIVEQIARNRQLQDEIKNRTKLAQELQSIRADKNASKEAIKMAEEALKKSQARIDKYKKLGNFIKRNAGSAAINAAIVAPSVYVAHKLAGK